MKKISQAAREMGRKGGRATLQKKGKKHYSEMAKKSWSKRRASAKKEK